MKGFSGVAGMIKLWLTFSALYLEADALSFEVMRECYMWCVNSESQNFRKSVGMDGESDGPWRSDPAPCYVIR